MVTDKLTTASIPRCIPSIESATLQEKAIWRLVSTYMAGTLASTFMIFHAACALLKNAYVSPRVLAWLRVGAEATWTYGVSPYAIMMATCFACLWSLGLIYAYTELLVRAQPHWQQSDQKHLARLLETVRHGPARIKTTEFLPAPTRSTLQEQSDDRVACDERRMAMKELRQRLQGGKHTAHSAVPWSSKSKAVPSASGEKAEDEAVLQPLLDQSISTECALA